MIAPQGLTLRVNGVDHTLQVDARVTLLDALIGVGELGSALARHLVRGGEHIVLAARDDSHAALLPDELGSLDSSALVSQASGGAAVTL